MSADDVIARRFEDQSSRVVGQFKVCLCYKAQAHADAYHYSTARNSPTSSKG